MWAFSLNKSEEWVAFRLIEWGLHFDRSALDVTVAIRVPLARLMVRREDRNSFAPTEVVGDEYPARERSHLAESDELPEPLYLSCRPGSLRPLVAALMTLDEVFLRSHLKVGP